MKFVYLFFKDDTTSVVIFIYFWKFEITMIFEEKVKKIDIKNQKFLSKA